MKAFFRYYGSKLSLAKHYGAPRRDLVVEPFAGSAAYSVYWEAENVKLYDISEEVCQLWDFIINCSEKDILALPDWIDNIDHLHSIEYIQQRLIARWIWNTYQDKTPLKSELKYYKKYREYRTSGVPNERVKRAHSATSWCPDIKRRIIRQKPKIKKWTIEQKSYEDIDLENAHWHVDPPYNCAAGDYYPSGGKIINYRELGKWCQKLPGAVDVCEKEGADWLPFKAIAKNNTITKKGPTSYNEVLWRKDKTGLFDA